MNSHIHLLEALAALHEVWPDKKLTARLREVFGLVRDTIVVSPPGVMNLYFTPQWRAIPGEDSFGHDIETAYLLVEAANALGMPDDKRTWQVARSLVDHTLEYGLDKTNGGFFSGGGTFGGITAPEKVWWTEAEALNALLLMHARYGPQTPRYWDAFVAQWNWIETRQIDPENGGWYPKVSAEGQPIPGAAKSDSWTEGYHQGRALLNVSEMLAKLISGAAPRQIARPQSFPAFSPSLSSSAEGIVAAASAHRVEASAELLSEGENAGKLCGRTAKYEF